MTEKYLLVLEDGALLQTTELTPDDFIEAEEGEMSIIRVSDMKQYVGDGQWDDIKKYIP